MGACDPSDTGVYVCYPGMVDNSRRQGTGTCRTPGFAGRTEAEHGGEIVGVTCDDTAVSGPRSPTGQAELSVRR